MERIEFGGQWGLHTTESTGEAPQVKREKRERRDREKIGRRKGLCG
jgi:hypothetical protein